MSGATGSWAPKKKPTLAEWWAQTNTKRMFVDPIVSGLTLPGDVYAGRVDPQSDEAIERAFDLAGTVGLGAGAIPARGLELRSGMARKPPNSPPVRALPSSASLAIPPPPSADDMARVSRTEAVPLKQTRGTQRKMDWAKFDAGDHPGEMIVGYGELPIAVRRNDGEYLIIDGHHRVAKALNEGANELKMHVIDAKDYAPEFAGRVPAASAMSDDDLLRELGVEPKAAQSPFASANSTKAGIGPALTGTAVAATAMAPQQSQAQSMPIRVEAPNGEIIEFPAGMSDGDIAAVMRKEFGGPKPDDPPPIPKDKGTFLDPLIGQGLFLGAGEEIRAGVRAAVQAPFKDETLGELYDKELVGGRENLASYRERHPIISPVAEIGGAITGIAATGGAGLLPRAATMAGKVATGALGGATAGGAYGFNAGEGGAAERLKGAAVGAGVGGVTGGAGGKIAGALANRGARAAAPSVDELKRMGQAAYKKADQANVVITPRSTTALVDDVIKSAKGTGFHPGIHKKVDAALGDFVKARTKAATFEDVDHLRRIMGAAAKSPEPDERRIASILIDKLDEGMDKLTPLHVSSGDPKATVAALGEARDLWRRMRKGEVIEDLVERAKTSAPNFSGSGMENALRTEFRALAKNKTKMRQFSMEEKTAIMKVARGGPVENVLRQLGKFAPTGVVSSVLSGGAGYAVGGPVGGIALPAMGLAARQAATGMTKRNVENVGSLVRSGGKLATTQKPLTKKERALLNMLLGAGVSGGPIGAEKLQIAK